MFDDPIFGRLDLLYRMSPSVSISPSDKVVVLSDLHMGNGRDYDGFLRSSNLFTQVLERHYLENGFKLILNGDVEDLQRAAYGAIRYTWSHIYRLFDRFQDETGLFKILGNHDIEYFWLHISDILYTHYRSLKLKLDEGVMFLYHGHQACRFAETWRGFQKFAMEKIANPLGISNPSVLLDKDHIRSKERRIIEFSRSRGILSLVGHTHRASFGGGGAMFNSGASTGSNGITALEIENGRISLVHWWDRSILKRYLDPDRFDPLRMGRADCYRVELNSAPLRSLFANGTV